MIFLLAPLRRAALRILWKRRRLVRRLVCRHPRNSGPAAGRRI